MPVQIPLIKSFITLAIWDYNWQLSCIQSLDANNAYEPYFLYLYNKPFDKYASFDFFCHLTLCPIEDGKYVLFFVYRVYRVNSPCSDKLHLGFLADSFSQRCVLPVTLYHFWVDGLLEYLVSTFVVGFSPLINFSSLNS